MSHDKFSQLDSAESMPGDHQAKVHQEHLILQCQLYRLEELDIEGNTSICKYDTEREGQGWCSNVHEGSDTLEDSGSTESGK